MEAMLEVVSKVAVILILILVIKQIGRASCRERV